MATAPRPEDVEERLEVRPTSRSSAQVAVGRTSGDRLGPGARPPDLRARTFSAAPPGRHSPDLLGQFARQEVVPEEPDRISKDQAPRGMSRRPCQTPFQPERLCPVARPSIAMPTMGELENGGPVKSSDHFTRRWSITRIYGPTLAIADLIIGPARTGKLQARWLLAVDDADGAELLWPQAPDSRIRRRQIFKTASAPRGRPRGNIAVVAAPAVVLKKALIVEGPICALVLAAAGRRSRCARPMRRPGSSDNWRSAASPWPWRRTAPAMPPMIRARVTCTAGDTPGRLPSSAAPAPALPLAGRPVRPLMFSCRRTVTLVRAYARRAGIPRAHRSSGCSCSSPRVVARTYRNVSSDGRAFEADQVRLTTGASVALAREAGAALNPATMGLCTFLATLGRPPPVLRRPTTAFTYGAPARDAGGRGGPPPRPRS